MNVAFMNKQSRRTEAVVLLKALPFVYSRTALRSSIILLMHLLLNHKFYAQDSTETNKLSATAYFEMYSSLDLGGRENQDLKTYVYNFNRDRSVNLNLGFIKLSYNDERFRANFALMSGTYAQYNMVNEKGLLKAIHEGNAGIKLLKKQKLWLDAGVMPSHIGFESAMAKDCWVLTRSIQADNTPYFESGIKLAYTNKSEKLYMALMYLNGWQKNKKNPDNYSPSFGTQITFSPKQSISINWSTFIGNDLPDNVNRWRYYNNIYAIMQFTNHFGLTAGMDIGFEQLSTGSKKYGKVLAPILIARYSLNDHFRVAARAEYYQDKNKLIIKEGGLNGFQTSGLSMNVDYLINKQMSLRFEGRALDSKDQIFRRYVMATSRNYFFTLSMAFSL